MATELQTLPVVTTPEPAHMKYGGSKIELTEICPGSVKAQAETLRTTSDAAERGTRIHTLIESMLKPGAGIDFKEAIKGDEGEVAKATVQAIMATLGAQGHTRESIMIEQKVVLNDIHPQAGGTLDIGAHNMLDTVLHVGDVKTGRNQVMAEDNIQMAFYALAYYLSLDAFQRAMINRINFYIFQPEQESPYQVHVRTWSIDVAEFISVYWYRIKQIIDTAEANPDLRFAGLHCEKLYCNAKTSCAAYKNWLNEQSAGLFFSALNGEVVTQPNRQGDIAKLLALEPLFNGLFKQAHEDAKAYLFKDPASIPGYKLVDSFGHRAWKNEKEVELKAKAVGMKSDDFKPRTMVSPAAFSRMLTSIRVEIKKANKAFTPEQQALIDASTELQRIVDETDELTEKPYLGQAMKACKEADQSTIANIFLNAK